MHRKRKSTLIDETGKRIKRGMKMSTDLKKPQPIKSDEYRYDGFENGTILLNKKKNHLPAMGWNSWNAFGSGNTEELTKKMADLFLELELDQAGYEYLVLDDGCYKQERVNGRLSNEEIKFPSGFKALADYIHGKGLKFGMYNDIGTHLCAGAQVGTCGYEDVDAQSYVDWDVDFMKVDNCYYLWDNATFSDATNAKYVYAPYIKSISVEGDFFAKDYLAVKDGTITGNGPVIKEDYVANIGTFDGTGPETSPVGERSGELVFSVEVPQTGNYRLTVLYASGEESGCGMWLQIAVGEKGNSALVYDDFLEKTETPASFSKSQEIKVRLQQGKNTIRLMNHRRQENTLNSYAAFLEGLNKANPNHEILFSLCEWGKTQPHNWAYKVGDSWRILNDITFEVGADGNPGKAHWVGDYTCSITTQYNKAVIMDEFAGLSKGWNDPDMLTIGMDGLTDTMNQTHMVMWCMMNSPLMLGMDLRRVKKGDEIWNIIANKDLIALNQDALGIQAKRIASFLGNSKESVDAPDTTYIRDNDRVDILAKPLADGSIAISFLNLSDEEKEGYCISVKEILAAVGSKMIEGEAFKNAKKYKLTNLWTKETDTQETTSFVIKKLEPYGNVTLKISVDK